MMKKPIQIVVSASKEMMLSLLQVQLSRWRSCSDSVYRRIAVTMGNSFDVLALALAPSFLLDLLVLFDQHDVYYLASHFFRDAHWTVLPDLRYRCLHHVYCEPVRKRKHLKFVDCIESKEW